MPEADGRRINTQGEDCSASKPIPGMPGHARGMRAPLFAVGPAWPVVYSPEGLPSPPFLVPLPPECMRGLVLP